MNPHADTVHHLGSKPMSEPKTFSRPHNGSKSSPLSPGITLTPTMSNFVALPLVRSNPIPFYSLFVPSNHVTHQVFDYVVCLIKLLNPRK